MPDRTGYSAIDRRHFVVAATGQAAGVTLAATAAAREKGPATDGESASSEAGSRPPLRLHVLGSGCPHPVPAHYGSAFILEVGGDFLMIDCGPATTYKMVQMGFAPGKIGHVFFTHHHFDHNADFPCFAPTRWDFSSGREPALKIYGPPPTSTFVEKLLGKEGAFFDDWNSRIQHPVSQAIHRRRGGVLPRPAPKFDVQDVGPGKVAESRLWKATAARVHHVEPWLKSLAFRFDTDMGSIVFAADCGDCEALRQLARDADTLVAACACIGSAKINYNKITGTADVVQIAQAAGVRRVILSHGAPGFSRPEMKQRAIDDVKQGYSGSVSFPEELTTVELST